MFSSNVSVFRTREKRVWSWRREIVLRCTTADSSQDSKLVLNNGEQQQDTNFNHASGCKAIKINTTLIIDESVAAEESHRIIKRITTMNPPKCGSCDGPQVQHKNTHPQQNQQEVSRANSDSELSQANFIIPRVNARLKRKREKRCIHAIPIISKVTNMIFSFLPTLVLLLVLFLTSTKTELSFFSPYWSPVHYTSDDSFFLWGLSPPTSAASAPG